MSKFKKFERVLENKPHPHAELMAQYAEDAKETDRPWERWEVWDKSYRNWCGLGIHPKWMPSEEYRRKPKTVNINGYEVPEPVSGGMAEGQAMYVPTLNLGNGTDYICYRYTDASYYNELIRKGLVHTTREAAELHAKALLSFTNGKGRV